MKVLGLYNNDCAIELFEWIEDQGHEVVLKQDRLELKWCTENDFDLTVSYTYRYILSADILEALKSNVVNIHNSILPWNRGADPNIWSIVDNSPRGVTLHYMDSELDKGYVIAQEIIDDCLDESIETLESSYYNLDIAAKEMFKKAFRYYEYWPSMRKKCVGIGSYHLMRDAELLKTGIGTYDTSISDFKKNIECLRV